VPGGYLAKYGIAGTAVYGRLIVGVSARPVRRGISIEGTIYSGCYAGTISGEPHLLILYMILHIYKKYNRHTRRSSRVLAILEQIFTWQQIMQKRVVVFRLFALSVFSNMVSLSHLQWLILVKIDLFKTSSFGATFSSSNAASIPFCCSVFLDALSRVIAELATGNVIWAMGS
jgi:hypothetical protein